MKILRENEMSDGAILRAMMRISFLNVRDWHVKVNANAAVLGERTLKYGDVSRQTSRDWTERDEEC